MTRAGARVQYGESVHTRVFSRSRIVQGTRRASMGYWLTHEFIVATVASGLSVFGTGPARGAAALWTHPNGGFWGDSSNWFDHMVPGPADDVVITGLHSSAIITKRTSATARPRLCRAIDRPGRGHASGLPGAGGVCGVRPGDTCSHARGMPGVHGAGAARAAGAAARGGVVGAAALVPRSARPLILSARHTDRSSL